MSENLKVKIIVSEDIVSQNVKQANKQFNYQSSIRT